MWQRLGRIQPFAQSNGRTIIRKPAKVNTHLPKGAGDKASGKVYCFGRKKRPNSDTSVKINKEFAP
jgi:hypothetical protein